MNQTNKYLASQENQAIVKNLQEKSWGISQWYCVKNGVNSAVECNDCGVANNPKLLFTTLYDWNHKGLFGCQGLHYCPNCLTKNWKHFAVIRRHRKRLFDEKFQPQYENQPQ